MGFLTGFSEFSKRKTFLLCILLKAELMPPEYWGHRLAAEQRACRQLGNLLPPPSAPLPSSCGEHSKERGDWFLWPVYFFVSLRRQRDCGVAGSGTSITADTPLTPFRTGLKVLCSPNDRRNASSCCRAGGLGYQRMEGLKSREVHSSCEIC